MVSWNTYNKAIEIWERQSLFAYELDLYQKHKLYIIKIALGHSTQARCSHSEPVGTETSWGSSEPVSCHACSGAYSHDRVNGGKTRSLKVILPPALCLSLGKGTTRAFEFILGTYGQVWGSLIIFWDETLEFWLWLTTWNYNPENLSCWRMNIESLNPETFLPLMVIIFKSFLD